MSESGRAWARSVVLPLVLALVCLRSLAHGGYLLQVDIVFGPRAAPVQPGFGAPIALLRAAGVEVVGGALTGRLYAVVTLFLAGFAPMVLLRNTRWFAQTAAGAFGMLNPWVYARFVDGQWGVVIAAAGLFLWVAAWEALQTSPDLRRALLLAACGAAIATFDPHALGPLAVLAVVATLWQRLWRRRDALAWSAASFGMLALFLAHAAVSFFVDDDAGGYAGVRQFTRADFSFFQSVASDEYGLIPNLIGLYGYWAERFGRFPVASADAAWWPSTTAVLVGAAVAGAWLCRERAWLFLAGAIGLAASASTALPGGVDAASWLAARLPLLGAYREPQKWSSLWLLALVTLSACAADRLAAADRRWLARGGPALAYAVVICSLFPAGTTAIRAVPTIVEPVDYPPYWFETAAYMERSVPPKEPVVVLPWHLYQPLRASGWRLVANPADVFFPGRLVVPRNLEIPGRFSETVSRYDRIGAVIRRSGYRSCAPAQAITKEGVHWVLVFDTPEGRRAAVGLRRCGFALVQGRPGRTAVLRS
jgi:hypothetical protein